MLFSYVCIQYLMLKTFCVSQLLEMIRERCILHNYEEYFGFLAENTEAQRDTYLIKVPHGQRQSLN